MDPTTVCCPNEHCPARGHIGKGTIGIHSRQEQRFLCHACDKTFRATTGTVVYRLRTSAETVVLIVPWLAPGCPVQALVAAVGCDERTVAEWGARSGRQSQVRHAYWVEPPRDLGQVQADDLRVKKQGGIVGMAFAMMRKTRLWLGGEGSEQRDLPLIRRLLARVRRGVARRPLVICTDGLGSSIRALRETCRAPIRTGQGGRPRRRLWRNVLIAHVGKHYERRRVVEPARRIVAGPPASRRSDGARRAMGSSRRQTSSTGTRRSGNASRRWRGGAGRWPARPGPCTRGCAWWARSLTFVRLTRVSTPARRPRRPWPLGSRTMAGRCRNCGRFRCRCRAGPHRSSAGVQRVHSNASLRAGARNHG